jgi:hypothetical protein
MENKNNAREIKQLIQDVAMLKEVLFYNKNLQDPEGELSDWEKKQLKKAREAPESECVPFEDVKNRILNRE